MTKHFVNWDGLDFKEEESDYNKYHRKPEHFKETFVGPRNTWGGARRGVNTNRLWCVFFAWLLHFPAPSISLLFRLLFQSIDQ